MVVDIFEEHKIFLCVRGIERVSDADDWNGACKRCIILEDSQGATNSEKL